MPPEQIVKLVLGILVAVVVLIAVLAAIRKKRGVETNFLGVKLNVKEPRPEPGTIEVARDLAVENSKVGNVAGKIIEGAAPTTDVTGDIKVADGAQIRGSEVGDIAGVIHRSPPKTAEDAKRSQAKSEEKKGKQ